jgi:uncharacterized protein
MSNICGRDSEIACLKQLLQSNKAEFVAIYGRRRVGKTFLIREFFASKGTFLDVVGIKDGALHEQLENFAAALAAVFYPNTPIRIPRSWREAFQWLTDKIVTIPIKRKVIIFLDELPWLATKRSNLLQTLDYFWNSQWSKQHNIKLIVCGSAASWILDNLINAKGGLYNRLTKTILLEPFTLRESQTFLQTLSYKLNQKQILDLYMVTGGVPHYLQQIDHTKSVAQNINKLCFNKAGLLYSEFSRIFQALFDSAEQNIILVRAMAKKRHGISRDELIKLTKISSGGSLQKRLSELQAAGFIQSFIPYGKKHRHLYYRVIDEYCLFYLHWIEPALQSGKTFGKNYWQNIIHTPNYYSWAGNAFESICFKHIEEIRLALGLEDISCAIGNWRHIPESYSKQDGAQIDLLFDRNDNAITLCEIKYSQEPYVLTKAYAKELAHKIDLFQEHTNTQKQIFMALVTGNGLKPTLWAEDLIQHIVTLEALF